jgi:hypothetical protein
VPQIVESESRGRAFDAANIGLALLVLARLAGILELIANRAEDCPCQPTPSRAPSCLWSSGINSPVLARGKYVVIRLAAAKRLSTAIQLYDSSCRVRLERNDALARSVFVVTRTTVRVRSIRSTSRHRSPLISQPRMVVLSARI